MALTDSLPTEDPAGLSITETRLIQAGDVVRAADGTPRLGLLPWQLGAIVTGTSGMAYSVAPFVAITSRNGAGIEKVANDAAASVSTTAAPGSNSRIDVIWVRCRFPSYTDAGQTTPVFGVTQGTAGASPAKPAIPAGALELATATVPSTATATNSGVVITQTHPYTALAGGTVLLRSQAEQDAWTPANGASAFRTDTNTAYQRIGGAWLPVFGAMPEIDLVSGGSQDAANTATVKMWAAPGTGASRNFGTDWFTYDAGTGDITVKKAGRYRLMARVLVPAASGQSVGFWLNSSAGVLSQDAVSTIASLGVMAKLDVASVSLNANAIVNVITISPTSALSLGGSGRSSGQFSIRYLGP